MMIDEDCCVCGQMKTEQHVLFEYNRYGEERGRWRKVVK